MKEPGVLEDMCVVPTSLVAVTTAAAATAAAATVAAATAGAVAAAAAAPPIRTALTATCCGVFCPRMYTGFELCGDDPLFFSTLYFSVWTC